MIEKLGRRWQF